MKYKKSSSKKESCQINTCNEQICSSIHEIFQELRNKLFNTILTIIIVTIFLTILNLYYIVYKNFNYKTTRYYPSPQITVYLQKVTSNVVEKAINQLQKDEGVEKVYYLSREEIRNKFHNWSGIDNTSDLLEEDSLPEVAVIVPKINFQKDKLLDLLQNRIEKIQGVNEVRIDNNSWFYRLRELTRLISHISLIISMLITTTIFLIISNNILLYIVTYQRIIKFRNLISINSNFIPISFLYRGVLLGFFGAFFSLILSKILIFCFSSYISKLEEIFGINFDISSLSIYECLFLLLLYSIIGWISAWFATKQYLRHYITK